MKKNGYTIVELLVVIGVLGLVVLITLATTSYAFKDHSQEYYETRMNGIKKMAVLYGEKSETLKEEKNMVITVNDLVKEGYLHGDKAGKIADPRNSKGSLNGIKIKISIDDEGKVEATVIDE